MWEDLPRKSKGSKIYLILLTILVVLVLAYVGYTFIRPDQNTSGSVLLTPSSSLKTSGSPTTSPSPNTKLSPSPTTSQNSANFQIPDGETYAMSSIADTNGDNKNETLVITKTAGNKYHAYVLSSDSQKLYDNPGLGQKPVRIATQTYSENDTFLSWMLVFTEDSGNLAMLHWNGTKYEIPASEGI